MRSKTALCHSGARVSLNYQCTINGIVHLSCVVDDGMSLGSRVAESKVGKPSHHMTYYVICMLHESDIQLQAKQRLSLL